MAQLPHAAAGAACGGALRAYRSSACGGGLPTQSAAEVIRWLAASADAETALFDNTAGGGGGGGSGRGGGAIRLGHDERFADAVFGTSDLSPSETTRAAFLIASDAEARRRLDATPLRAQPRTPTPAGEGAHKREAPDAATGDGAAASSSPTPAGREERSLAAYAAYHPALVDALVTACASAGAVDVALRLHRLSSEPRRRAAPRWARVD